MGRIYLCAPCFNEETIMGNNDNFYCYSLHLYHFLRAFGEKCKASKEHSLTGNRYWVFAKSERLDKIIILYNEVKHKV